MNSKERAISRKFISLSCWDSLSLELHGREFKRLAIYPFQRDMKSEH